VTTLVSSAITVGVGGGLYGVDQPTLHQQMAVFLLKARHGLCYTPRSAPASFRMSRAEQLPDENITDGCGGGNYCPGNNNTRGQMAVFITKTFGLQ
jgi:hypothetical protein